MQSKQGKIGDVYDKKLYPGVAFVLVSDNTDFSTDEEMVKQYEA
jgi:hypothetical protein